ncbi:MAG: hypothetical protein GX587_15040 [Bacteroidales bacterium]|nr:hypothetical protein [Bacteroidales bacterium]
MSGKFCPAHPCWPDAVGILVVVAGGRYFTAYIKTGNISVFIIGTVRLKEPSLFIGLQLQGVQKWAKKKAALRGQPSIRNFKMPVRT